MPETPLIDHDLFTCRVRVAKEHVVLVKGIFEASEGLGAMFAERGGELMISAPHSRTQELEELLKDLAAEFGAEIGDAPCPVP
jgi:hypothetical protein